jgi:hypothetical protein
MRTPMCTTGIVRRAQSLSGLSRVQPLAEGHHGPWHAAVIGGRADPDIAPLRASGAMWLGTCLASAVA